VTTAVVKTLPEWPGIFQCLTNAAKQLNEAFPESKVELVTTEQKFLIVMDGFPVIKIQWESITKTSNESNLTYAAVGWTDGAGSKEV
jgi:hypothetical protein